MTECELIFRDKKMEQELMDTKQKLSEVWKYCSTLESQIDASLSSLCNTLACMDKRNAFYISVKVVADSLSSIREYPAEYVSEQIAKATKVIIQMEDNK